MAISGILNYVNSQGESTQSNITTPRHDSALPIAHSQPLSKRLQNNTTFAAIEQSSPPPWPSTTNSSRPEAPRPLEVTRTSTPCSSAPCRRRAANCSRKSLSFLAGRRQVWVRLIRPRNVAWRNTNATTAGYEGVYSATPPPQLSQQQQPHGPNVLGGARGGLPQPILPVDLPPQAFLTSAMLLDMVDSTRTLLYGVLWNSTLTLYREG